MQYKIYVCNPEANISLNNTQNSFSTTHKTHIHPHHKNQLVDALFFGSYWFRDSHQTQHTPWARYRNWSKHSALSYWY